MSSAWDEFGRPLPEKLEMCDTPPTEMEHMDVNDEVLDLRKLVGRLCAVNRTLRRRIERQATALSDMVWQKEADKSHHEAIVNEKESETAKMVLAIEQFCRQCEYGHEPGSCPNCTLHQIGGGK